MDNTTASLQLIQDVFRQFRPRLLAEAGTITFANKADGSPVTDTDVEIEKTLQAALAVHFPDVPVYGEETGYGSDLPPVCWLVDPIDGTQSFIQNIPSFTCMAVLIQAGQAVASIIYNPSTDMMYTAQKGAGAYKNGQPLDLRTLPLASKAFCKGRFTDALNTIMAPKNVVCEMATNGAGYGFTLVADGSVAARFQLQGRGSIHDYAPGALLVQEAGGAVIPIADDEYDITTSSFVVCHPELESLLRQYRAEIRAMENMSPRPGHK